METATKQKLKKAIQEGESSVLRTLPLLMISAGLVVFANGFLAASSEWLSPPGAVFGCLNLSAFLVFGGLIWLNIKGQLDALAEASR